MRAALGQAVPIVAHARRPLSAQLRRSLPLVGMRTDARKETSATAGPNCRFGSKASLRTRFLSYVIAWYIEWEGIRPR
jgi:hypothetical protein